MMRVWTAVFIGWACLISGIASEVQAQIEVFGSPEYIATTQLGFQNGTIPVMPGGGVNTSGTAVGYSQKFDSGPKGDRAVRWGASGAAVELGNLGLNADGITNSYAYAINDTGTVAGYAYKYDAAHIGLGYRAVRWNATTGAATELGILGTDSNGFTWAQAYAMNGAGTVVGYANKYDVAHVNLGDRAVRWDATTGAATELGVLGLWVNGDTHAKALDVNSTGAAVGWSDQFVTVLQNNIETTYGVGSRAVRWDATTGAATELGILGVWGGDNMTTSAIANAINDAGTAVGWSKKYVAGVDVGKRAVRWDAATGAATELGILGTGSDGVSDSAAVAINSAGTAVGYVDKFNATNAYLGTRAARWDATTGALTELGILGTNPSGTAYSRANAINNAGTTVGYAEKYNATGVFQGARAIAWAPNGAAIDLNELLPVANDGTGTWILTDARAIGENGWVAGVGTFTPTGGGGSYQRLFTTQIQVGFGGAWTDAVTGTLNGVWSNGQQWSSGTPAMGVGDATFNRSATYTVSLDRNESTQTIDVTAGNVTFATAGFTLESTGTATLNSGATLTINNAAGGSFSVGSLAGGGNLVLGSSGITAGSAGTTTTFSGVISGTGGLTKTGLGMLTLSSANTYSGGTTINGGVLSGSSLATTTSTSSSFGTGHFSASNGGVLRYTGGNVNSSRAITVGVGGGTLEVTAAGTKVIWDGSIQGSGSFTKSGPGTLSVIGNNQYAGDTIILGGVFDGDRIANSNANSSFGRGNVQLGGGTLQYTGAGSTATDRTITLLSSGLGSGGAIDVQSANNAKILTWSGLVGGTGNLTKLGGGTLDLGFIANNFTGKVVVAGGYLRGSTIGIGGVTSSFGSGTEFDVSNEAVLQYMGGNATTNRTLTLSSGRGWINVNNAGTTLTWAGKITGPGSLARENNGTLVLTNPSNDYAGSTDIQGGTVRVGASEVVPNGSAVIVASGKTFDVNNFTETVGSIEGAGGITLGSGNLTAGGNGATTTFSGVVSGASGGLTKAGAGTLTLSGANTYSGTTTITGGVLSGATITGASSNFGTGNFALNGGTLQYTGPSQSTARTISLGTDGGKIEVTNGLTLLGKISGSGAFTKAGNGTVTLANSIADNNYSGATTVQAGSLRLGADDQIPGFSPVTIAAGATLDMNNFYDAVGSIAGSGNITLGSGTLLAGFDSTSTTYAGTVSGTGSLTKSGTGTMTLTGSHTYTGGTTINGGTLQLGSGGTSGSLAASGPITNNGSFVVNRSDSVTQGTHFSGAAITGTGSLTHAGTGTTTLTAANTYAGGTTVNGGRLYVNNTTGSGTGTGSVVVNNAAVLGGAGTISGSVMLNHTATLAPGNSPGTLTIGGDLTLGAASTSAFELNGANTTIGGGVNDLVNVGGNLALDGTLNVTEAVVGSFASAVPGNKWRLYNYGGTLANNGLDLGTLPALANSHWAYQVDTATAGQVNLNVVNTLPVSFTGVGDLAGGTVSSFANAISADGTTVVGASASANGSSEAYRWTSAGGIIGLGDLLGGTFGSIALGVSADGSVIVGRGNSSAGSEPFRWTASSGTASLNTGIGSNAYGVSADGSTVVGVNSGLAFRWTEQTNANGLPGGTSSAAEAVSADGNAIAGGVVIGSINQAARWSSEQGLEILGELPGGNIYSYALAISSDGRAVVGLSSSALSSNEAFRWTRETGIRPLGDLAGGAFNSWANGVAEGGGVVVGLATAASGQRAFYWDALDGIQELQPFLAAEFGLVMPGWTLTEAKAITPDGRIIVGNGTNPSGNQEGWKVDLSQIVGVSWVGGSDSWDTGGSWKYGWHPRAHDPIALTPVAGAIVTGPADAKTVHSITVNATTGTTELRLQNDFTATAGITVGGAGKIVLTGQELDAGSGLVINGAGRVQGYGIVYGPISGSTGAAGVLSATRSLALTQPLVVGSRQARVLSIGVANLGPDASLAGGSITAPNGLFVGGGNLLHGHGTVNARISAGIGSQIAAEGGNLTLGSATSPAGFFSDGDLSTGANTVTINDANDAVLGSLTTLGDGVNGGTLVAGTAFTGDTRTHFLIEQGKNLIGRGHVVGNVKNHGSVIGDGPSLLPNERIVFDAGWKVSGIGDFANVLFDGTFAPGLSPGVVAGRDLAIGGTLEIELGGATPGNGIGHHDQVNDAGIFTMAAGAALALQPYGGFLPSLGEQFTIVTAAAGFAGEFASVTIDPWFLQHGIDFQLNATSTSLLITAVAPVLGGDFNSDGSVDAADYVVWRHGLGATYTQADLADWRANFGKSFSAGSAFDSSAVPEPSAIVTVLLAIAGCAAQRRGKRGAA